MCDTRRQTKKERQKGKTDENEKEVDGGVGDCDDEEDDEKQSHQANSNHA